MLGIVLVLRYGLSESTSGFIYQSVKSGDVGATGRLVSHALVKLVDPDDNGKAVGCEKKKVWNH